MITTSIDTAKLHRARAASALLFYDEGLEIVPIKHNGGPPSGMDAILHEPHVVEWSFEQKCFHVQGFTESLRCNLRSFLENRPTSYMIVALCRSSAEACAVCDKLQAIRDKSEGRHSLRDMPRSKLQPELPLVYCVSSVVHFPDSGHDYEAHIERLRDDLHGWIEHLRRKDWWTTEQEEALRELMEHDEQERIQVQVADNER